MARPSVEQMMDDPKLVAAAKRIFEDHYAMATKRRWEDLPTEFKNVPLGEINYRFLCLSLAWSAFETIGMNRLCDG